MGDENELRSGELKAQAKSTGKKLWTTVLVLLGLCGVLGSMVVLFLGPSQVLGTAEPRAWFGVHLALPLLPLATAGVLAKWSKWLIAPPAE